MKRLVEKYSRKLMEAGLADSPLVCGYEEEIVWNRLDDDAAVLVPVLHSMNINSLVCARPAEPYLTILRFLVSRYPEVIIPQDCETRTFLHDLPVSSSFSAAAIMERLRQRKSVITIEDGHIRVVTSGTVSPEQAFVTYSSVCFAAYVLFFADYLDDRRHGRISSDQQQAFDRILPLVDRPQREAPELAAGPFTTGNQVTAAMIEAGRRMVEYRLVDSYFGNISYRLGDIIYISQTGSSLDELAGCIDPCPLDGSSCAGITASSELSAHSDILLRTDNLAILHGHPKFAVILSMDCDLEDCPERHQCHIKCSRRRFIKDIPIVPGEVGTGPTGLCHTLPPAVKDRRGAIVWGHGLFTVGKIDFREAFTSLLDIENMCRQEYLSRAGG
jgi:ribulose-5-phosphate 4-epimerase/fuculose-1-phosphate aldolase